MSRVLDAGMDETKLVVRRTFEASRERVFRAWTDPRRIAQWMGPKDGFTVPSVNVDLKVGGRYDIVMRSPDGERHYVGGEYIEIIPPERLVYTWAWVSTPERISRVTVDFAEAGSGRTRMTLTHDRFHDSATRDRHDRGWLGTLDRFTRYLATAA